MLPGSSPGTARNGKRLYKLESKLGLSFAFMAVLISALLTFALYRITVDWLREGLRHRIRDAAAIGAGRLNGDDFSSLTAPSQEDGPVYQRLQNELRSIRDAGSDYRFVYTMRQTPDGKIHFVVDAEEDPELVSHLGDVYDDAGPALTSNIRTSSTPWVEEEFYTDKWGTWLTGYAPVMGADGKMKIILAMDVAADTALQREREFLWSALAAFGVTLPISLLLGGLLGKRIARPIIALTEGAEQIAGGDLEHVVDAHSKDEIGELAVAFNTMTGKLIHSLDALRKSEETLIQHRDNLESTVAERTACLAAANERMNRDLESAAEVQKTFLPRHPPNLPGVHFAWSFTPCDELAGDMLDICKLDSRHVGVWVVDVCGHGVAAALVSVTLSRLLSTLNGPESSLLRQTNGSANGGRLPPQDIAHFLNGQFAIDPETMRYFTFLYGILDVETREFRYVSAGHPGPVLITHEGESRILPMSPPAIGILPKPEFVEHRVTLSPGDRLYLYTDGITESTNAEEEEFGRERMTEILNINRSMPLQQSIEYLMEELEEFSHGKHPADDLSLVAVEVV